jgi:hypothetical protein
MIAFGPRTDRELAKSEVGTVLEFGRSVRGMEVGAPSCDDDAERSILLGNLPKAFDLALLQNIPTGPGPLQGRVENRFGSDLGRILWIAVSAPVNAATKYIIARTWLTSFLQSTMVTGLD